MSRCISCNEALKDHELYYRHKLTKKHDGFCINCRTMSYDTVEIHEYVHDLATSPMCMIKNYGSIQVEELPTFNDKEFEGYNNDYEDENNEQA